MYKILRFIHIYMYTHVSKKVCKALQDSRILRFIYMCLTLSLFLSYICTRNTHAYTHVSKKVCKAPTGSRILRSIHMCLTFSLFPHVFNIVSLYMNLRILEPFRALQTFLETRVFNIVSHVFGIVSLLTCL